MSRYAAFLRGMNLGGRRITNVELVSSFEALGCQEVAAFLASGNVVFSASGARDRVTRRIEDGLREALGYDVPTHLRTAAEVRAIASHEPFSADELTASAGKLQVAMFAAEPSAGTRSEVLALATTDDRLALDGRELYWLPSGNLTDSELDARRIDILLGGTTMRTRRTLERMAAKFFSG